MGSLLAPAKCGIIFIGILIGQVGRGSFLVPMILLASPPAKVLNPTISGLFFTNFPACCYFPGLPPDLRVTLCRHTSVSALALALSSGWGCNAWQSALGKWRQPPSNSGQSIVQREANSPIPRNPRIQELGFGIRRAPALRVNQTDSHTAGMKAGGRWVSV